MDYGEILTTAWKITWKNKVLWLFGILIGFTQAVTAGNQAFQIAIQSDLMPRTVLLNLAKVMNFNSPNFWVEFVSFILLITCGLMFFMSILTSLGQTGILKGVALADDAEDGRVTFGDLTKAIKTYFWRIFGFTLLVSFVFLFLFLIIYGVIAGVFVGGAFATRDSGPAVIIPMILLGLVCLMPLFCIFILISWAISALLVFTMVAIVNDDLGIFAALAQAFKILKKHFWKIFLLVLLISAIAGIIGSFLAIPISASSFVPLTTLRSGRTDGSTALISILFILAYTPIMVFLESVLVVYSASIWVLAYRRLTKSAENPVPIQPTVEPAQG